MVQHRSVLIHSPATSVAGKRRLSVLVSLLALTVAAKAQRQPSIARPADACTYTLSYYSASVPATFQGASATVSVSTGPGCGWSASVTDATWIKIISGASGTGNGTIGYTVDANQVQTSRTGHINVQGEILAITQVALLGPVAQVQGIEMTRNPISNSFYLSSCPQTVPVATRTFTPTDAAAYMFLSVTQVNPGDVISDQYIAPDGSVYSNAGGSYTVAPGAQPLCLQDQGMKIQGALPANMPGAWTVNVSVNGVLVITTSFTIVGNSGCSFAITSSGFIITALSTPPTATSWTLGVTTTSGCSWSVSSNASWIVVTGGASGTGSGTFSFTVGQNTGDSRTGLVNIGGQILVVTQVKLLGPSAIVQYAALSHSVLLPNQNCTAANVPAPASTFAPTDAAAYLLMYVTAVNNGDVIAAQYYGPDGSLYSGAGGSFTVPNGTGQVCLQDTTGLAIRGAPPANLPGTWTVKILVNQALEMVLNFTITGSGTTCTYTLNSTSASFPSAGGTGNVTVTANAGCSWTASTVVPWIHVTSGSSGSGGGSVGYSVDVNSGAARTGTITIAGQVFTVSETAAGPNLPSITQGGVADPWTYTKGLAPGVWVSIFGTNLSSVTQSWSPTLGQTLATTLGGVTVTIDGNLAVPNYVSPTLVNVLVPAAVRLGQVQIVVTNNGAASLPFVIQSTEFLPSIYSNAAPGSSPPRFYVTAVDPTSGSLLGNPSADPRVVRAPRAGDIIDLYAVGLGPTTPSFPTGTAFTGSYQLTSNFNVVLGGANISPTFAALVAPGLYQVRITVPLTLTPGDQSILLDFGGGVQSAQNVFLTLQR